MSETRESTDVPPPPPPDEPDRSAVEEAPILEEPPVDDSDDGPLTPMDRWEQSQDSIRADNADALMNEADILEAQGNPEAAGDVREFVDRVDAMQGADAVELADDAPGDAPVDLVEDAPILDDTPAESTVDTVDTVDDLDAVQASEVVAAEPEAAIEDAPSPATADYQPPDAPEGTETLIQSAEDLPPDIQLSEDDVNAMEWPAVLVERPATTDDQFEKLSHWDWDDTDSLAEREPVDLTPDDKRLADLADDERLPDLTWVRRPEEGAEEFIVGAVDDIRTKTAQGRSLSDDEVGELGKDLSPSDPVEGLALRREFAHGRSRAEAQNARFALTFEGNTTIRYLESRVAPQEGRIENRTGNAEYPGGQKQVYLLGFDRSRARLNVRPVGGRVRPTSTGDLEFGYADRPLRP